MNLEVSCPKTLVDTGMIRFCLSLPLMFVYLHVAVTLVDSSVSADVYYQLTHPSGATGASFSVFSGSLPTGLALAGDGVLFGTPSAVETFEVLVQATLNQCDVDLVLRSEISCGAMTLNSTTVRRRKEE